MRPNLYIVKWLETYDVPFNTLRKIESDLNAWDQEQGEAVQQELENAIKQLEHEKAAYELGRERAVLQQLEKLEWVVQQLENQKEAQQLEKNRVAQLFQDEKAAKILVNKQAREVETAIEGSRRAAAYFAMAGWDERVKAKASLKQALEKEEAADKALVATKEEIEALRKKQVQIVDPKKREKLAKILALHGLYKAVCSYAKINSCEPDVVEGFAKGFIAGEHLKDRDTAEETLRHLQEAKPFPLDKLLVRMLKKLHRYPANYDLSLLLEEIRSGNTMTAATKERPPLHCPSPLPPPLARGSSFFLASTPSPSSSSGASASSPDGLENSDGLGCIR